MPYGKRRKLSSGRYARGGRSSSSQATRVATAVVNRLLAPTPRERVRQAIAVKKSEAAGQAYRANPAGNRIDPVAVAQSEYMDWDKPAVQAHASGRGGYFGRLLGGAVGGLTGNSTIKGLAADLGDKLGDHVYDKARSWFGRGDYTLKSNSLIGPGGEVVTFGGDEGIRVRQREYLGPVFGSTPFSMQHQLIVNPGNPACFPHLSRVAQYFQQYVINGCIFLYKSTSGDVAVNGDPALGEVVMATNYDAVEASYRNKADMLASAYCNADKPSVSQAHGLECAAFSNVLEKRYIRHGDEKASEDPKTYDFGKFQLAVQGTNANATQIGELWVTYDITLNKPRDSEGSEVMSFAADIPDYANPMPAADWFRHASIETNNLGVNYVGASFYLPPTLPGGTTIFVAVTLESPSAPAAGAWDATMVNLLSDGANRIDSSHGSLYGGSATSTVGATVTATGTFVLDDPAKGVERRIYIDDTQPHWPGASLLHGAVRIRLIVVPDSWSSTV